MFDRKKYKSIAKKQLTGRWKTPALATLIVLIITSILNAPAIVQRTKNQINSYKNIMERLSNPSLNTITEEEPDDGFIEGEDDEESPQTYSFHRSYSFNVTQDDLNKYQWTRNSKINLLIQILEIFIISVISMALRYVFIRLYHTKEVVPFNAFLKGFNLWLKAFLSKLWFILWVLIWSLPFFFILFIPGFIKMIEYSMMFNIIIEYPDVSIPKAMRLSKEITRGYKSDLFVMLLSFLGWAILCVISQGIGFIWFIPYFKMSFINAYHDLKAMAISSNRLREEDFTGVQTSQNESGSQTYSQNDSTNNQASNDAAYNETTNTGDING